MEKETLGWLVKIPLFLMLLTSFGASVYAVIAKIQGVRWASPIILLVIIGLFVWGEIIHYKIRKHTEL